MTVTKIVLELKKRCEYDIVLEEEYEDSIVISRSEERRVGKEC